MYTIKFWLFWTLGVAAAAIILSLFKNEGINWGLIATLSIAGLIGSMISARLKKAAKKDVN
ncbi:hypothetical protein [Ornithinibacillus halotolerans]|uniref:Uncharacterized protein n=1 Tax=Ornithinibacillus halotolerans TaxID=1274357 RepID=A0A916WA51_9BACI|nr:hypothetical protein [Ornithinibacillus halotolerans]GGA80464.1 hypothetical protein GCM10008025_24840 [Ornithinibacillus halotolerans]